MAARHGVLALSRTELPPARTVVIPCLVIVVLHAALRPAFERAWSLGMDAYLAPSVGWASLGSPAGLLAWLVPVLWIRGMTWHDAGLRRFERLPVLTAVAALAWSAACYRYNPFFGRGHEIDRSLVLLLGALCLWRPVFLAPFLALGTMLLHQFDWPTQQQSFTDKQPVLDVLSLALAYLAVRRARSSTPSLCLLFVLLTFMASSYLMPGIQKVKIGWLAHDQLRYLTLAAFDNGWLAWMGADGRARVIDMITTLNVPIMLATLLLELGTMCMLWRRWLAIALLIGLVGMHLGIFASSGILFWKWICIDVALAVAVAALPAAERPRLHRRALLVLSLVLLALSEHAFAPRSLGWLDTPVNTVYRFEGLGSDGRRYEIAPAQFSPYDFVLAQGRFAYLGGAPTMVGTYGSVDRLRELQQIEAASGPDDLARLQFQLGKPRRDDERSQALAVLLRRFLEAFNARPPLSTPFAIVPPLPHIWTAPATDLPPYTGVEELVGMEVRRVSAWFAGEMRTVFRDEIVLAVGLPRAPGG